MGRFAPLQRKVLLWVIRDRVEPAKQPRAVSVMPFESGCKFTALAGSAWAVGSIPPSCACTIQQHALGSFQSILYDIHHVKSQQEPPWPTRPFHLPPPLLLRRLSSDIGADRRARGASGHGARLPPISCCPRCRRWRPSLKVSRRGRHFRDPRSSSRSSRSANSRSEPISDRYGRRWPVLAGFAVFLAGSIWCGPRHRPAGPPGWAAWSRPPAPLRDLGAVPAPIARDLFSGAALARRPWL